MGSIGTAVYRGDLDALPAGPPAEAHQAARDTLGGAVAVAGQLPESAAAGFLDTAREAFTHGLQVTAATSVLVAAATAILVTVVLRRAGVDAPSDAQPEDSFEDTGTPYPTDRLATVGSPAKLPGRCCAPELVTTAADVARATEPT
jgi:DHA2 family multidrug resistance protein-like MFS transporter